MRRGDQHFNRTPRFANLNNQLIIRFDGETVARFWEQAGADYAGLAQEHAAATRAERRHLDEVLPVVAVYRTLKEFTPDEALDLIAEQMKINALQRRPLMLRVSDRAPGLFVRLFRLGARTLFGSAAGFRAEFHRVPRGQVRFDMLQCPYHAACTGHGCPELTRLFCENDVYAYGSLPRVEFRRTQTLGTGGTACDFFVAVRDKNLYSEEK